MTAIFYGVSPAVIALILHSCWRLSKLGMEDWLQWVIATICFVITIVFRAEVAVLFVGAGIVGILYYGSFLRRRNKAPPASGAFALIPISAVAAKPATTSTLGQLFTFFFKAGSLTFGSGLVIVPFLEKGLVQQTGWLNGREFFVAVAVGMLSLGRVVITATFVGYLVAAFGDRWSQLSEFSYLRSCSFFLLHRPLLGIATICSYKGSSKGPTQPPSERS